MLLACKELILLWICRGSHQHSSRVYVKRGNEYASESKWDMSQVSLICFVTELNYLYSEVRCCGINSCLFAAKLNYLMKKILGSCWIEFLQCRSLLCTLHAKSSNYHLLLQNNQSLRIHAPDLSICPLICLIVWFITKSVTIL